MRNSKSNKIGIIFELDKFDEISRFVKRGERRNLQKKNEFYNICKFDITPKLLNIKCLTKKKTNFSKFQYFILFSSLFKLLKFNKFSKDNNIDLTN